MKKILITIYIFSIIPAIATGQVLMQELLTQNHEGILKESVNFPGEVLKYEWVYEETAGLKSSYKLNLYRGKRLFGTFDVRMRNLIVTFYIEVRMPNKEDGSIKTLTGVYDKGNKWMRVKMAPHPGCKREGVYWGRLDQIGDFRQILDYLITQMDKNVILECYSASRQMK